MNTRLIRIAAQTILLTACLDHDPVATDLDNDIPVVVSGTIVDAATGEAVSAELELLTTNWRLCGAQFCPEPEIVSTFGYAGSAGTFTIEATTEDCADVDLIVYAEGYFVEEVQVGTCDAKDLVVEVVRAPLCAASEALATVRPEAVRVNRGEVATVELEFPANEACVSAGATWKLDNDVPAHVYGGAKENTIKVEGLRQGAATLTVRFRWEQAGWSRSSRPPVYVARDVPIVVL